MSRLRILGVVVAAAMLLPLLVIAEGTVRWLDGYQLSELRLSATKPGTSQIRTGSARDAADARYFSKIPLARGIDPKWYPRNPPPLPRTPMAPETARRNERYESVDRYGAFFAWNRVYLRKMLCAGLRFGSLGVLDDFYVFDPPTATEYPIYRHLSNISPPLWFPTNRFGWRGPDIVLNKPKNTIRIAFVGSSMTIDPYGAPFSHIEYIGEWLNLWAQTQGYPYRIEVINAARTGIDAASVRGIVLQELAPLEPDLVIFDGANDFKPGMLLRLPPEGLPPPQLPRFSGVRWRGEGFSALLRRVRVLSDRLRYGNEPEKPSYPILWPTGVDEFHPRLSQTPLPMGLQELVGHFDAMRTAVSATGGQFALSSQVVMVRDNLKLQLPRDQTLFVFLNSTYYPLKYAEIRRLMDFQNRVFQAFAAQYRLPFFDKAAVSPLDPELFVDAVHMTPPGLRLQSWIYLQWLATWLETEIANERLPRPMQHPQGVHPGFGNPNYPLISKTKILETCQ